MKNYRVVVEEVYRGWEWVEASSAEEAEQIVRDMTRRGELEPTLSYDGETFFDVVDEEEDPANPMSKDDRAEFDYWQLHCK